MDQLSFIPLGGIGDVTKNMYLYEYKDEILVVDCGLGFADETMLGVDLLLPDISYLLSSKKKVVGILLTHGHEDHIGALPFILPQLTQKAGTFPVLGAPLTAALANHKLKEFGVVPMVKTVAFSENEISLGSFRASFIRVTHSVPDTSHIFIQTPVGNFYHGSDFKFDETPWDKNQSDRKRIEMAGRQGVLCLLSDCLGAERVGRTPSEEELSARFESEMAKTKGKFIVTTYSSNISRLNQVISATEKLGRKVCFIGRSLLNIKEVAQKLGYMVLRNGIEVRLEQLKQYKDSNLVLLVAGSQGQENSAMARIANGEHKEVKLREDDVVVFSSDPIPGNEVMVYSLIDSLAKRGIRVVYSDTSDEFHVSGHGSKDELSELITLTKPKFLLPIGGNFRHMVAYRTLSESIGYKKNNVLLLEDGQEVVFSSGGVKHGRLLKVRQVYVDEISGEEVESFVLRDRQKLSEGGIVVILCEVDSSNGKLVGRPDIIARGFTGYDGKTLSSKLFADIRSVLGNKKGRVTNWVYLRKLIGEVSERRIFRDLHRRPLVIPVVIEV